MYAEQRFPVSLLIAASIAGRQQWTLVGRGCGWGFKRQAGQEAGGEEGRGAGRGRKGEHLGWLDLQSTSRQVDRLSCTLLPKVSWERRKKNHENNEAALLMF